MAQVDRPALEKYLAYKGQNPNLARFLDAFYERVDLNSIELTPNTIYGYRTAIGLHKGMVGDIRPVHLITSEMVRASGATEEAILHYRVYRDTIEARMPHHDFGLTADERAFRITTSVVGLTTARLAYAEMLGLLQAALTSPRTSSS